MSSNSFTGPTTPDAASPQLRFGLLRVRSPLLAESLLFSLPPGTEMFQFPGFAPSLGWYLHIAGGLPHSEIRASRDICSLARLIAACHVLHRLREPRHPSCALLSFPFFFRLSNFGSNSVLNISPDCFAILIASQSALKLLFFFFRFTRFLVTELLEISLFRSISRFSYLLPSCQCALSF